MYTKLATALAVVNGTLSYSQAVAMSGNNNIGVDLDILGRSGGSLTVHYEFSNDLVNWATSSTPLFTTIATIGSNYVALDMPIGSTYVRLRYTQNTSGMSIVAAGINEFLQ